MMIQRIVKNSNSNYLQVKNGNNAAKGTDEWLVVQMKKKITTDNYINWFKVMMNGNYKQKAKARKYAKKLLSID